MTGARYDNRHGADARASAKRRTNAPLFRAVYGAVTRDSRTLFRVSRRLQQ